MITNPVWQSLLMRAAIRELSERLRSDRQQAA